MIISYGSISVSYGISGILLPFQSYLYRFKSNIIFTCDYYTFNWTEYILWKYILYLRIVWAFHFADVMHSFIKFNILQCTYAIKQ